MSKNRSNKKFTLIALAALVIPALALMLIPQSASAFHFKGNYNKELSTYYSSSLAYGSGCGDIFVYPNTDKMSLQIPKEYWDNPPSDNYIPSPFVSMPMYGYLSERGLTKDKFKFYGPDSDNSSWSEPFILRTLRDNKLMIIWYDPKQASPEDLDVLKQVAEGTNGAVMVMPWLKFDNPNLPMKRAFAFNMFGASQSCSKLDLDVMNSFAKFVSKIDLRSDAPPNIAKLNDKGVLNELVF